VSEPAVVRPLDAYQEVVALASEETYRVLRHRGGATTRRRGWLVRRALLAADVLGLTLAFTFAQVVFSSPSPTGRFGASEEWLLFVATIPAWVVLAKLYKLYDRDAERAGHTTADDAVGVFHLVTVGSWVFFVLSWWSGLADPDLSKLVAFWVSAVVLVVVGRALARSLCRRSLSYVQNTIIVGAGDVGQLIARKILHHPEYGLNLVGFIDASPRERHSEVEDVTLLGPPSRLETVIRAFDVERVIVSFSSESSDEMLALIRELNEHEIQVDIVPRLYELVGPKDEIHMLEGLPLVGLPPARLSRSSLLTKRAIDVVGASIALILAAPLLAYIAVRIKLDSSGPVLFRQTRLGHDMREFTALKFRTMRVDVDAGVHRDYIKATMSQQQASAGGDGLYKLSREDAVTPFGRWLRKTSLDELPQLLNVLRGEMSLVGPRPCIPYETEFFKPHHFERFLVPQGITGLWQVTARAHSTFGEALDMDVAYVRGWSLGLDLRLLFRTPVQLFSGRATA